MRGVAKIVMTGVALLGVLLSLGWAHAQAPARSGKLPRVAIFVTSPLAGQVERIVKYFEDDMRELGWVEGRNLVYDRDPPPKHLRDPASLREHATKLIGRRPDLIWVANSENALALAAAQNEAKTEIPVVCGAVGEDILELGLSNRVGRNFTGVVNVASQLGGKRLELVNELMPTITRVGVLVLASRDTSVRELGLIEKAAAARRIAIIPARIEKDEHELEAAFAHLVKNNAQAVMTTHVPFFQNASKRLIVLSTQHGLPLIGHRASFAEQGAIMAYGTPVREHTRVSARLADKILNGVPPATLPVEQPMKFELVLNAKTAKLLGMRIPENVLVRADRFID